MIAESGAGAQQLSGELVSPDYFTVLGIRPAAGRFFGDGERDAVVVISYGLWRDRFGARPRGHRQDVAGRRRRFTVIGVAPESFRGIVMDWAEPPSVWTPVQQYKRRFRYFPSTSRVPGGWSRTS